MRVFWATLVNQTRAFYRDPAAAIFTFLIPLLIMFILSLFNIHVAGHRYIDVLLPGMIAYTATGIGLQSIVFGIMRYKERGVLRRIKASPASPFAFVTGVAASRVVMVALSCVVTYLAGRFLFGAQLTGSLWGLLAISIYSAPAFIALGLIAVGLAKNEDQAGPVLFIFLTPMLLFSGTFIPRAGLNATIAWVTQGLPMTYLVDALQRVSFLGQGFSSGLWTDLLGLTIWAVVALAVATRTWSWES